jgi:hypothetical protein
LVKPAFFCPQVIKTEGYIQAVESCTVLAKKLLVMFSVIFVFSAFTFSQWKGISVVKAAPDIYQGDLILQGNNVTVINGRFDINGSIIVEGNATLHLLDAYINFTQTGHRQYNLSLQQPFNGIPRLIAANATITSGFEVLTHLKEESVATVQNSTITSYLMVYGFAFLSVTDVSYVNTLYAYSSAVVDVYNSTIDEWHNYDSPQVHVHNSVINSLLIGPESVECTISNLGLGLIDHWNFITDCSVNVLSGGSTPNVTLTNTFISHGWRFAFYDGSNASVIDSEIGEVFATGSSIVNLRSTHCTWATVQASSILHLADSSLEVLEASSPQPILLLNSTYTTLHFSGSSKVHLGWHLNAHVVDSLDQNVNFANVTATYANTTIAERKLTDTSGEAQLALIEKIINASGEYPVGNYSVEAAYGTYSTSTSLNMTENKQITLKLEGFVIPEFPAMILLPLLMLGTLLAVLLYRKRTKTSLRLSRLTREKHRFQTSSVAYLARRI